MAAKKIRITIPEPAIVDDPASFEQGKAYTSGEASIRRTSRLLSEQLEATLTEVKARRAVSSSRLSDILTLSESYAGTLAVNRSNPIQLTAAIQAHEYLSKLRRQGPEVRQLQNTLVTSLPESADPGSAAGPPPAPPAEPQSRGNPWLRIADSFQTIASSFSRGWRTAGFVGRARRGRTSHGRPAGGTEGKTFWQEVADTFRAGGGGRRRGSGPPAAAGPSPGADDAGERVLSGLAGGAAVLGAGSFRIGQFALSVGAQAAEAAANFAMRNIVKPFFTPMVDALRQSSFEYGMQSAGLPARAALRDVSAPSASGKPALGGIGGALWDGGMLMANLTRDTVEALAAGGRVKPQATSSLKDDALQKMGQRLSPLGRLLGQSMGDFAPELSEFAPQTARALGQESFAARQDAHRYDRFGQFRAGEGYDEQMRINRRSNWRSWDSEPGEITPSDEQRLNELIHPTVMGKTISPMSAPGYSSVTR